MRHTEMLMKNFPEST